MHRCPRSHLTGSSPTQPGSVEEFDPSGALRRIRRLIDTSQREFAASLGLSKTFVAAMESGRRRVDSGLLARAAKLAGLRLALLDGDGAEVAPMSAAAVTDLGGRRFPAHLDTHRSDEGQRLHEPRRDRPETSFTYGKDRGARDAHRRTRGTPTDHHPVLPGDTPAARLVARRQEAVRARAEERERRFLAGEFRRLPEFFECRCPSACDALDDWSGRPVHAEDCPCSCDVG